MHSPKTIIKKIAVFTDFWYHSKKQAGFSEQGFIPFEEIQKNPALCHLTIPIYDYIRSETRPSISDLLKHESYLYIRPDGINALIPTDILIDSLNAADIVDVPVTVDGRKFYDSFNRTFHPGKLTIQFGESIEMCLEENSSIKKFHATFTH